MAWKNHFLKGRDVFSNYNLYGIPFTKVKSLEDLENMRDGFFAADELWLWLDARTSTKQLNKVTSDILLKSRKRGLTYCFTSQNMRQLDTRVRNVLDFTLYPVMKANEALCQGLVFRGGKPNQSSFMKTIRFRPRPVYSMFNSREEVPPLEQTSDKPLCEEYREPHEEIGEDYEVI